MWSDLFQGAPQTFLLMDAPSLSAELRDVSARIDAAKQKHGMA